MAKDEKIPNIGTSWEGYAGSRVEEFIKEQLNANSDAIAGVEEGLGDLASLDKVATTHIEDGAVTADKLSAEVRESIAAGGGVDILVDTAMSDTSTNAVQNKVIKDYVDTREEAMIKYTDDTVQGVADGVQANADSIAALQTKVDAIPDTSDFVKDGDTVDALGVNTLQVGGNTITASGTSTVVSGQLKAVGVEGVNSVVMTYEDMGAYAKADDVTEVTPIVLTQAEYDALVSNGTVDNSRTYYITDEESGDSGSGDSGTTTPTEGVTTIRINQTISDPNTMITRIVDNGGIEAIRANSHRYVGTYADGGTMRLKQLDDLDGTKYADGTSAEEDLAVLGNDVWMKLPQFYYKCTEYATDQWDFSVAYGVKPDDNYKEWDGNDLIGAYEAYVESDLVYSASYKESTGNMSHADFKHYAQSRGIGYSLVKWKHHCMMAMLFYTQYGHTNSQEEIGYGQSYSETAISGGSNSLGMEDTVRAVNGEQGHINFWGLEAWWGDKYELIGNLTSDANGVYVSEDDDNIRTIDYHVLGEESSYPSKLMFGEYLDLLPTEMTGSGTTGFCDRNYYESNENAFIFCRSGCGNDTASGISYLMHETEKTDTHDMLGSRLAFRGTIEYV